MTKKLKTSRNQNLMQRIYSCNDYVCMHKREPEGFRKRRKSSTVLVETGAKIAFYLDFDLVNFYTIFCLFVVMFLPFFENTIPFPVFQNLLVSYLSLLTYVFRFTTFFKSVHIYLHTKPSWNRVKSLEHTLTLPNLII